MKGKKKMQVFLSVREPASEEMIQSVKDELKETAKSFPGWRCVRNSIRFSYRRSEMQGYLDVIIEWTMIATGEN